jgi:hypothetical protein
MSRPSKGIRVRAMNRTTFKLAILGFRRGDRLRLINRPNLASNSTEDLEDIVHAQQRIIVDREASDANLLFRLCGVVAYEFEEAQLGDGPDIAAKPGHGLFVRVQQDEVPVFSA